MPVGRILNRFTADFNQVDSGQAYHFAFGLYNLMLVLGIVVAGVIVSPYIILCAFILLAICSRYALYYLASARQTKRLESTAKSPVFDLFSAALAGVSTLRAFDKTDTYIKNMFKRVDTHAQSLWYQWLLNRWLSWRLNVIGALFSFIVAALIVSLKGMDAALGGFALGFTLQYTEAVTWLLRNFAAIEIGMNSVERIIEYSEITTENEGGTDAPASWPTEGRLSVEKLVVGYAPDLPPVLKGLTFSVERNERIGVVGRTGAGKSSLTLALFRFLEAREGSIHIDGIDISKIKMHDLRSRIAIIPQDPVLFSGTVRSNLDPFDEHSDQELKDALERVHLVEWAQTSGAPSTLGAEEDNEAESSNSSISKPQANKAAANANTNTNVFKSLRSLISEGGLNLSQGQRQLLCLARAIVARPKIMILDEATSAVDKATDALIQRSIREEFQDSTLIVIAHRLSTIVDFDRILVMSEGKVAEYDSPKKLIEQDDGIFTGMIESSGESEVLRDIIVNGSAAESI
jgi:ABC-type multidrug transport system fused ATPase/permease subunit